MYSSSFDPNIIFATYIKIKILFGFRDDKSLRRWEKLLIKPNFYTIFIVTMVFANAAILLILTVHSLILVVVQTAITKSSTKKSQFQNTKMEEAYTESIPPHEPGKNDGVQLILVKFLAVNILT